MNHMEQESLHKVLVHIKATIAQKRAAIGFDGFVDHIVKPVNRSDGDEVEFFEKMAGFAGFLNNHNDMSCSIELMETSLKMGGNNPITSHALGTLGAEVSTLGAYGNGTVDPAFHSLSTNCTVYPVTESGRCFALEFDKNKLMLFINKAAREFTFAKLMAMVSLEQLADIYENADMVSLLNYSELPSVLDIWEGLLENVLPQVSQRKMFFFDLSDCSRIHPGDLAGAIQRMTQFRKYGTVYLDMNDNEFLHVYKAVVGQSQDCSQLRSLLDDKACNVSEMEPYLKKLYEELHLDCLIFRPLRKFIAYDRDGMHVVDNIITKDPKLLTGAGDNQNAGICAGLMCGNNISDALRFGALVGSYYTQYGYSPTMQQLEEHLASLGASCDL